MEQAPRECLGGDLAHYPSWGHFHKWGFGAKSHDRKPSPQTSRSAQTDTFRKIAGESWAGRASARANIPGESRHSSMDLCSYRTLLLSGGRYVLLDRCWK